MIFGFTMGSNENEDDLDDVFSAIAAEAAAARGVVSDDDDDVGFVFVPISTNNTSTSRFDE